MRLAEFKQQDLQDLLSAYQSLDVSTADIGRAIAAQQSHEQDAGSNFWTVVAVLMVTLLIVLILWRVRSG